MALSALDRTASSTGDLHALVGRRHSLRGASGTRRLLPGAAEPFFRATRVDSDGSTSVALPRGFALLVVLDGSGTLEWADGTLPIRRGDTLGLPDALGETRITGEVGGILCRPPLPDGPSRS